MPSVEEIEDSISARRDVDVVIVNYRTSELTIEAARSVLGEPELSRVIVVDNVSQDGSFERINAALAGSERVVVLSSNKNLGFGGGNNYAVRRSSADYVFLLNSDAYIKRGCLGRLRNILQQNSQIGLVAPAVYLRDQQTLQEATHGPFPTPARLFLRATTRQSNSTSPDWISGVALMARRREYERVGGFDEAFFMYLEDVDLCRRYREVLGLDIHREVETAVIHLVGQSAVSKRDQLDAYDESQDRYLAAAGASTLGRISVKMARKIYRLWR